MAREPLYPRESNGPAVHGLVIGVGGYQDPAVPSLPEATLSACAFATWLHRHQAAPGFVRGSLDALISSPSGAVTWEGHTLDPPTLGNVQAAIDALFARVDPHPDDMFVFYFCGHGVELGLSRSLLLEDVALTSPVDPFRNAIAFNAFVDGMAGCGPRKQVYVLDACRELPPGLSKWSDDVELGDALVRANTKKIAALGARTHVILDATSSTQKAWSGPNGGWFTDALLTALAGAAGDNRFTESPDRYSVSTRDLADVVQFLVDRGFIDPPAGPQTPRRRGEGDVDLHAPPRPVVPVLVSLKSPPVVPTPVNVRQAAGVVATHVFDDSRPWRSELAIGEYLFEAGGPEVQAQVVVPGKKVELP